MPDASSPYIDMWKDWEPDILLIVRNAARKWVTATGLVGITFRVSLTEQGAAIGTLAGIATTEATTAESEYGLGGRYFGLVDLATLTSEMPDNATFPHGTKVYLQALKPGDIVVEARQKIIRRLLY